MYIAPYVVISDIHFFNRRTPTSHIIDAFWEWLEKHSKVIKTCKLFILAGDVFDKFIPSHSPDVALVNNFFFSFGVWLAKYDITLIALEGTATHDRKQFKSLLPVLAGSGVKVKYYQTVCVDVVEGVSILFVPDNWSNDPSATLADAQAALVAAGLEQVDIGIMHGYFEYQLPMMKHGALDQHGFETLVRHRIHIGHVHLESTNGKVDAQGSFDRISHSEERDKGGCAFINGKRLRLVNKSAMPYITLPIKDGDPDVFLLKIDTTAKKMRYNGWLRIQADRKHAVFDKFPEITVKYPMIRFERQYTGKISATITVEDTVDVSDLSTDRLLESIKEKNPSINDSTLALIRGHLEEVCV